MDATRLEEQLQEAKKLNEELRLQNESLRGDNESLRHDYESLAMSTQAVIDERRQLQQRVDELEATNKRLIDMLWGRRSERRTFSSAQLTLDFGEPDEADDSLSAEVLLAEQQADEALDEQWLRELLERRRKRRDKEKEKAKQGGAQAFPAHLERRERVLDLSDDQKEGLTCIGEVSTERLRFEKPHVYVERIVRPKYVHKGQPEQGVLTASVPLAIAEGCKYDFSVIAAVLAQKFAFHQPTYRQQDWFAQSGWYPSRSTLNDLINVSVETLLPLFDQLWWQLLQQPILLGDDTRVLLLTRNALTDEQLEQLRARQRSGTPPGTAPVKDDSRGSVTSYAWLYTGLEEMAPYNVFHWSLTHQHAVVDKHLRNFRGTILGDAYSGYAHIEERSQGRIAHAGCNVHARREFLPAESSEPILSAQAVSFYRQLYDVEERGKALDADGLQQLRQRKAVPIWQRFGQWLETEPVKRALPKSPFGKAVGYLRNQWAALQRYLSDGRLPIDNQQSEQQIRPLTVGRNNWLFIGHPQAAVGRLQLASVVSSAHRNHLVVHDYLEDVLTRLADAAQHHPADLQVGSPYLLDLLPDRWAATHPQSVRHERVQEQQVAWETKRERRARQRLQARQAAAKS